MVADGEEATKRGRGESARTARDLPRTDSTIDPGPGPEERQDSGLAMADFLSTIDRERLLSVLQRALEALKSLQHDDGHFCGDDDLCHPERTAGQGCPEGDEACADDLYCDNRTDTCAPYIGSGGECGHATWACDDDLYCSETTDGNMSKCGTTNRWTWSSGWASEKQSRRAASRETMGASACMRCPRRARSSQPRVRRYNCWCRFMGWRDSTAALVLGLRLFIPARLTARFADATLALRGVRRVEAWQTQREEH